MYFYNGNNTRKSVPIIVKSTHISVLLYKKEYIFTCTFSYNVNIQSTRIDVQCNHKQNNRATAKGENEVAKAYRRHQRNTGQG